MDILVDTFRRWRVTYLLLIYLCVVKVAADCPKPKGEGNIVLTNAALLLNDFPEDTEITYECSTGHTFESGSGFSVCQGGNWSQPDLICKKKDCGPPKGQPNMRFNTSEGTLFGAVAKVECGRGYRVSGSSYKQCLDTGWKRTSKCVIITCNKPKEVIDGRHSWDSEDKPKYGEIIQYTCNEGYTLVGDDKIMCSERGEYDPQPPECRDASTDSETTPTNRSDNSITSSATPTISPSAKVNNDGTVDLQKDSRYTAVILSVISVVIAALLIIVILYKLLLRKKGTATLPRHIY